MGHQQGEGPKCHMNKAVHLRKARGVPACQTSPTSLIQMQLTYS